MAQKTLDIARTVLWVFSLADADVHVGLNDTLTIKFHHSGTFCSPDPDQFNPPLPNHVFFKKGQEWPESGGAAPKGDGSVRYHFRKSSSLVECMQADASVSGFHVIHIP